MGIAGVVNPIFFGVGGGLDSCLLVGGRSECCAVLSYCLVMIVSLVERGRNFFFFFEGNMLTLAKNSERKFDQVLFGMGV